jgi:hypothetical protein
MGKASSSKKVARAARAGGRVSGVRQRNLGFPALIVFIVVLGGALVGFAWNDRTNEAASEPPVANQDHWHAAYGFNTCGEWQPDLPEFEVPGGTHTHADGVVHIHPFAESRSGDNATLMNFLDDAGVTLTEDELRIGDNEWVEGETECDGEPGEIVVAQWLDVQNTDDPPALITENFDDIRFREDGEGYTIAFVPEGQTEDIPKPESAANLADLGAQDAGAATEQDAATSTTASTAPAEGGSTTAPPAGGETTTTAAAGTETTATTAAGGG